MGGFHGGASSGGGGGGFHGGSHHSSGSSSSSHTDHHVINGKHYINGKRYYGAYYGTSNGKPMTFAGALIFAGVFFLAGLFFLFVCIRVPETATITKAWLVNESSHTYEKYTFSYSFAGTTYEGYGDDEAIYKDGEYTLDIKVGEQYPVYVSLISPSDYNFQPAEPILYVVTSGFALVGLGLGISAIVTHEQHKKKLASIGDANGDGVIDDKDIEHYEAMKEGEMAGIKQAAQENAYNENKMVRVCKYCRSVLADDARFCPSCGASASDAELVQRDSLK